jgi:hypothetical protein
MHPEEDETQEEALPVPCSACSPQVCARRGYVLVLAPSANNNQIHILLIPE